MEQDSKLDQADLVKEPQEGGSERVIGPDGKLGTADPNEAEKSNLASEIAKAIADTRVLLQYLGRSPDSKLQAQFQDANPNNAVLKLPIRAPCDNYSTFLNELSSLWIEYKDNHIISGKIDSLNLSKLAFLLWSRDFLAFLAGPATAASVRFTQEYIRFRFAKNETTTSDCEYARLSNELSGVIKLVNTMHRLTWSSVVVMVISVLLSAYALSGQKILAARDSSRVALKELDNKIETIEQHGDSKPVNPQILRYLAAVKARSGADATGKFFLCDNVDKTNSDEQDPLGAQKNPSFGPVANGVYYYFWSVDQIEICKERRRTLTQLFAVGEELIAWQRVLTNPIEIFFPLSVPVTPKSLNSKPIVDQRSDFATLEPIADGAVEFFDDLVSAPADIFGRTDAVPRELANNTALCESFGAGRGLACAKTLSEISQYYGTIPENILSCLTLYILPCLYGFLGSAVAIFKYMRIQVDSHLLSFTTRGRLIQTQILGVVLGSIVGLFAAYITNSNQSFGAFSVSAIAFLAGYNVPSVLTLFDDLSGRLFLAAASSTK